MKRITLIAASMLLFITSFSQITDISIQLGVGYGKAPVFQLKFGTDSYIGESDAKVTFRGVIQTHLDNKNPAFLQVAVGYLQEMGSFYFNPYSGYSYVMKSNSRYRLDAPASIYYHNEMYNTLLVGSEIGYQLPIDKVICPISIYVDWNTSISNIMHKDGYRYNIFVIGLKASL